MISALGKYMLWLLVFWLKPKVIEGSLVHQLFDIFGLELDAAKLAILDMRRESLIATASGTYLDNFGLERGLERVSGESDEEYRIRLLFAYVVKKKGGTIPGMIEALALLGMEVEINEIYKTDPSRWANFELIILSGILILLNQTIFYQTVNSLKPAHTRAIIVLDLDMDEFDDGEDFDDSNYFDEFVDT